MRHRTTRKTPHHRIGRMPLAAAIIAALCSPLAMAQEASAQQEQKDRAVTLDAVTVTAQKREENLQKVPISMQVLGTQQLQELQVRDAEDYLRLMPSVSLETAGPGFGQVYMRGVASGGDGNHSGSLPSVGIYLDEQPITTIQGALDLHVFDLARVETLSGPQGTLYGASSQSGTIRLITNKPDPSGFATGGGIELNSVSHGGLGYVTEAFVNVPLSERSALRVVGWHKKDAGYIDNVFGSRTYPYWDADTGHGTDDNREVAEDDYNWVETTGARAALRFDLDDNWTITPQFMAQKQIVNGAFATDPQVGDYALTHFYKEYSEDKWWQGALTVTGKVGNFDLTYAFSHLKRDDFVDQDYNDYGFWYDAVAGYGAYFCSQFDPDAFMCAPGGSTNPSQFIHGIDGYSKTSHELRLASPQDQRFRFVAGVFWQDQKHDIEQRYMINDLDPQQWVEGWPDTIWLTQQDRRNRDSAVFGEASFDITDKLTLTAGGRYFWVDNSLKGFFGYGDWGWSSSTGEAGCISQDDYEGAPCLSFDKRVKENDLLGKINLNYQIDDNKMVYAIWSQGYRPGGINRRGTLPPYLSDYLDNFEFGWKTTWLDNRLSFNGAVFEERWKDFQFSIIGPNGLTEIRNANQARIRGLELDVNWAVNYNFRLGAGLSLYDAELTKDYCGWTDANGKPVTSCPNGTLNPDGDAVLGPQAPAGTRLPVTSKGKGFLTGRYTWDVGAAEWYVQGVVAHEDKRSTDLRVAPQFPGEVTAYAVKGDLPAWTTMDVSAGFRWENYTVDFYIKNVTDERVVQGRFTQCPESICGASGVVAEYPNGQVYETIGLPRLMGIRFGWNF